MHNFWKIQYCYPFLNDSACTYKRNKIMNHLRFSLKILTSATGLMIVVVMHRVTIHKDPISVLVTMDMKEVESIAQVSV